MGTLLDSIEAAQTLKGPRCRVAVLLEQLPPDMAGDFRTAVDSDRIQATAIVRALNAVTDKDGKRLYRLAADSIRYHRRKLCLCQPA